MAHIFKKLYICTASILMLILSSIAFGTTTSGPSSATAQQPSGQLQDSKQAIQFFKEEMKYLTNPHDVKQSIDKQDKTITIIDVRSAKDFAEGHIPGAINIPYEKFNGFHGNETEFKGLRKDGYNVIYCYELLCNLAKNAAIKFASLGYPVKEMQGGFQAWKEKGNPIEK